MRLSKEENKALIDAMNLIGEFCKKHLPEGCEIDVCMTSEEQWIDVYDVLGEMHDFAPSGDQSALADAVDWILENGREYE